MIDLRRIDDVPHLQLADVYGLRLMVPFAVDHEFEASPHIHLEA